MNRRLDHQHLGRALVPAIFLTRRFTLSRPRATKSGVGGVPPVPPPTDRLSRLLTPAETAQLFNVSEAALERWRSQGDGPPFVRLSHKAVRYRTGDLVGFIEARVVTSTAQVVG